MSLFRVVLVVWGCVLLFWIIHLYNASSYKEAVPVEVLYAFDDCLPLLEGTRPLDTWGVLLPFVSADPLLGRFSGLSNLPRRENNALVYRGLLSRRFYSGMPGFVEQAQDRIVIHCTDRAKRRLEYRILENAEFRFHFPQAQMYSGFMWVADFVVKDGKTGALEMRYYIFDEGVVPSKKFKASTDPPDIPTLRRSQP